MAEQTEATGGSTASGTGTTPGEQPQVVKWLLVYTLGRLAIAAALIALFWVLGLPGTPGFLFGVLLAMPVAYLALGPVRKKADGRAGGPRRAEGAPPRRAPRRPAGLTAPLQGPATSLRVVGGSGVLQLRARPIASRTPVARVS